MEVITEMEIPNKTLTEFSPISQPVSEENVVVTTTVVKESEVSVVNEVDTVSLQEEKFIGNLVDKDEGLKMKVNCSENGAFSVTGVDLDVVGEKSGFLADPMDVCSTGENKKSGDNGIDIFEFKEDIEDQDASEEEEDHGFVVGDFVWAKIKSYQWWPGQVYDPSDASDWAATLKRKGRVLVVCFGDDSFSWCSPKQLKPFIGHFDEMLAQSVSKKFVNAVQLALEEASRLVERELICKCQTNYVTENAVVVNRGIREGVHVPKGNTVKDLVNLFEPVALVSSLKAYATMGPAAGVFELKLAVVKSCLRGFYSKKGGLVECQEPKCIEGLEEEESGADPDITGLSESPENSDDKLHRTRKQKSVEELFGEEETEIKKPKVSRNASVKDKKRKALVVSVEHESDYEDNGGGDNGVGGGEEEITSTRQRKKSKYLSPPYLSPVVVTKLSALGSGSFKEPKLESEKVPGIAAEQDEDSPKKSSGKGTRQKRRAREGSDSQELTAASLTVSVTEVLNGLLLLALDPSAFVENLQAITEFISSFRGLIFRDKSQNKTSQKSRKKGAENKTLGSIVSDGSRNKTSQKKDPEEKAPGSIDGPRNKTSEKKDAEDKTSDIAFVKNKLKWMWQTVHACEEGEMKAGLKESLEGAIQEVIEKVGNMQQGK